MTPVVLTEKLGKTYRGGKTRFALQNLDLAVQQGEIFGYLGPNGAGKTTTIKLLLDLIRPDIGSVRLFGLDSRRDSAAIRRRVGYLPGDLSLWPGQTGAQVMRYFAQVRGLKDMRFTDTLVERLSFDPSKRVRSYSSGNRRKLGLILALMHQPELLILDEPTGGLDPLLQQDFIAMMREARAAGQTVFLSSHMLNEVQAICDHVGILRDGRLLAVQAIADLSHASFHQVTITLRDPAPAGMLAGVAGVSEIYANGPTLHARVTGDFDPLLKALAPLYVRSIQVNEPSLEDIFMAYYGDRVNNGRAHRPQER